MAFKHLGYGNDRDKSKSRQRILFLIATTIVLITLIVQLRNGITLKVWTVSQSKQLTSTDRHFNSFVNRWGSKFHDSSQDGYLFFKHIRKAGKTK